MKPTKHPFLFGTLLIVCALFIGCSLGYYNPRQCPFHTTFYQTQQYAQNPMGIFGAVLAFWSLRLSGFAAWLMPIYLLWMGLISWTRKMELFSKRHFVTFSIGFFAFSGALAHWNHRNPKLFDANYFSAGLGGWIGEIVSIQQVELFLGSVGTPLLFWSLTLACIPFAWIGNLNVPSILNPFLKFKQWLQKLGTFAKSIPSDKDPLGSPSKISAQIAEKSPPSTENTPSDMPIPSFALFRNPEQPSAQPKTLFQSFFHPSNQTNPTPVQANSKQTDFFASTTDPFVASTRELRETQALETIKIVPPEPLQREKTRQRVSLDDYTFPPIDLLEQPELNEAQHLSAQNHQKRAEALIEKLAEFGVDVKVQEIHSGPVITRYEITPSPGVRVERIINLEKNIALGLKATSVRIVAPVPGKGCVGIELPNETPLPVCLKDILESKAWAHANADIPIVLGKEVTGKPIVADLTRMPHLLIAGSTGSGKTVCINTIIASLLFHSSPEDLRFIMVDPKIVEMQIYNDLPHMLIPVVTDPKKVPSALKWLIAEMERRYQVFAQAGARNITSYNARPKTENTPKLPYIVCIVDELADLMMVAPADIETCVARLAQLARAAGIHLILATQRPSVNVITGIIKANLPSRIAFKVASKVDSRTILDYGGADNLIGRGDMLFVPPGASTTIRAQGAFVSDNEIASIVQFVKDNNPPVHYAQDIQEQIDQADTSLDPTTEGAWDDELIPQAIQIIRSNERASTSLLQRRLRIGYNRAARIMEILQERGLVNSENGANKDFSSSSLN